jgi:hypothetical protein
MFPNLRLTSLRVGFSTIEDNCCRDQQAKKRTCPPKGRKESAFNTLHTTGASCFCKHYSSAWINGARKTTPVPAAQMSFHLSARGLKTAQKTFIFAFSNSAAMGQDQTPSSVRYIEISYLSQVQLSLLDSSLSIQTCRR